MIRTLNPRPLAAAALTALALNFAPLLAGAALAANGDCGQPLSNGSRPTASDALFILRVGVGQGVCILQTCDADNSGRVTAGDALRVLKVAVGDSISLLLCPGPTTTTTTSTSTSTSSSTSSSTSTTTLPLLQTWTGIQDLFQTECSGGFCHTDGQAAGGLSGFDNFDTGYANIIDVPANSFGTTLDRVEPGDSSLSFLMHKLDGTHRDPPANGSGSQMPQGRPALSQEIRDDIRAWINAGAAKN